MSAGTAARAASVADRETFHSDLAAFARERDAIRAFGYVEITTGEGLSILHRR